MNLLNKIDSLPEDKNAAINDLDVRGKMIFYRGGKCLKLAISMHFRYCEVMEKYIRLMIDFDKWSTRPLNLKK